MNAAKSEPSVDPAGKAAGISAGEAHNLAVTAEGEVYSWGRGTFGRLGTGSDEDEMKPVRIEFPSDESIERRRFVGVAAGAYHSLALEDDGTIWSWGYNLYGQLGAGSENSSIPRRVSQFHDLAAPFHDKADMQQFKVQSVRAGAMMSLAIDSLGGLWIWGNCPVLTDDDVEFSLVSVLSPQPVWAFYGHRVVKVACGNEHVIALVSTGDEASENGARCFSWGLNNDGQLGLGDYTNRLQPEIIKTFDTKSPWIVHDIACGAFHTAILTHTETYGRSMKGLLFGEENLEKSVSLCWTFGQGQNGQLGHGTVKNMSTPQPVKELPNDVFLMSVDCGLFHTCVVSESGDVWRWGMERGLGLCPDASFAGEDSGDALYPLKVECDQPELCFMNPVRVACGAAHTVLVAREGYKMWAWGRGRSGVLGGGNTSDSILPCLVLWPPAPLKFEARQTPEDEDTPNVNESVSKDPEIEKKLKSAVDDIDALNSKLTLMRRYTNVLHSSFFGDEFSDDHLELLQNDEFPGTSSFRNIWLKMMESADMLKLSRMKNFYQGMLGDVEERLMKQKVQDIVNGFLSDFLKKHGASSEARCPFFKS